MKMKYDQLVKYEIATEVYIYERGKGRKISHELIYNGNC
jgi:hypothetical protein